jgi:hypothetical protein
MNSKREEEEDLMRILPRERESERERVQER